MHGLDRFHVQRLVQDALDETRRDEARNAVGMDQRTRLKGTRVPTQKSPWNLTDASGKIKPTQMLGWLTASQLQEAPRLYGGLSPVDAVRWP